MDLEDLEGETEDWKKQWQITIQQRNTLLNK